MNGPNIHRPASWKDWRRVLMYWNARGHDGFTIHALATIVRRPPSEIFAEILAAKWGVKLSHCLAIKAPVIMPNIKTTSDGGFVWIASRFVDWNGKSVIPLVENLIEAYPWPKYKGIKDCQGIITPPAQLAILRAVARNKKPWHQKGGSL